MRDALLTDATLYLCDSAASVNIETALRAGVSMAIDTLVDTYEIKNLFIDKKSRWGERWESLADALMTYHSGDRRPPWKDKTPTRTLSVRVKLNFTRREYSVICNDGRWAFNKADMTPAETAATLGSIAHALKMGCIAETPAATGLLTMQKHSIDTASALDEGVAKRLTNIVKDLDWSRPLFPSERSGAYVVCYDANAAYLACAQNIDFGLGAPRLVRDEFHAKDPGFYYVKARRNTSQWVGDFNPNPFTNKISTEYEGWVPVSVVNFARDQGWHVSTPYGYHWPVGERSRMFRNWSTAMWEARQSTEGITRQCIKNCYTGAIGRLAANRPDWQQLIIGENRARRLRQLAKLPHLSPFLIENDGFYFIGNGNITELEKNMAGLGGYKFAGSWLAPKDVDQMLHDHIDAGEILNAIKKQAVMA